MLRDSVSAMEFSQPVCTITAVSKDLVRRPTRIHMILVSPPYRTNWGCLLADSGTIRRGSYSTSCGHALVCSYYVRCVSTPEIFGGRFGNHSRTGSGKAIDNTQDEPSRLSSSGVPFAGLQPVPGRPHWAADPAPLQKDDSNCASRTLLSSCLRGQCRLTLWGTLDARASRRGPPRPFSSIAAMYPVLASATAPGHSGALSLGPNVAASLAGFKEVSYYHRVTPCGPENRARRTPRSWRGFWGLCRPANETTRAENQV